MGGDAATWVGSVAVCRGSDLVVSAAERPSSLFLLHASLPLTPLAHHRGREFPAGSFRVSSLWG